MAGLMQPGKPPMEDQPQESEDGEMASPEEQALYDEIVGRAYLLMFDGEAEEVRPAVLESLQDDADPVAGLAETVSTIYQRVAQEARKGGVEITPDVRLGAITEIFEKLAEIAETVNGDFLKDDKDFEGAFFLAVDAVRVAEQEAGALDPAQEAERLKGMNVG